MPTITEWVEPAIFLEYSDITIYHTYKDDDVDQGKNTFWFTANIAQDDEHFDVRNFEVPSKQAMFDHPPFMSRSNPIFAQASDEEKTKWATEWAEWHRPGGGQEKAIATAIREAIDLGLITMPADQ